MSDRLALANALANAIQEAGIERSKAERVASVIFDAIHQNVATKADVQASDAALRTELKSDIAAARSALASEIARLDTMVERLDAKVGQIGSRNFNRLGALTVVVAIVVAVVLFAALHYWPPH